MKKRILFGFGCVLMLCALRFGSRVLAAEELVGPIYPVPRVASFHSLAHTNWPWQPAAPNLFTNAVYAISGWTNHYVYNDLDDPGHTGGLSRSEMEENGGDEPGPLDFGSYGTNLFIMIGLTNSGQAWLSLSNTHSGTYYQILNRVGVAQPPWEFGQILQASSSLTPFANVEVYDPQTRFFRGVGGDTVAKIYLDPDFNLAAEPSTNGGSGQVGRFLVSFSPALASARTVVYRISGTASNSLDFTNLTGSVSVPAGGTGVITIQPSFDTNAEFYESLTLGLVLTNGYLVDPQRQSATMQIYESRADSMAVAILDSGWTKLYGYSSTNWNYFVLPEAMKEALRSDGTPFVVLSDLDIKNGQLMSNGVPKYPILIDLGGEVIRDDEIAPLTNYVAAGGFIFAGSSAFTRATNGAYLTNFALGAQMGMSCQPSTNNWLDNTNLTKLVAHRVVSDIPDGNLLWRMPTSPAEISWGTCANHSGNNGFYSPHQLWQVSNSNAQVLAYGDFTNRPYLAFKQYGSGYFIYDAAAQPLIAHGGFGAGMYAYSIFKRAIEWAFESAQRPVVRLSPWPYDYNTAFIIRHDLENFTNEVADIEGSALVEHTNYAKGDYYFCTGTLREDAAPGGYNTNVIIASLRRAVTNYGATIGPHNGGLVNPVCNLARGIYEFWHWGPDEVLDLPGGRVYASNSVANSFADIEGWLGAAGAGPRVWVAPYFNATREDCYVMQEQMNVKIGGDQKLTPFPHWTLSTQTDGKRFAVLSEPTSDWFTAFAGFTYKMVAQSLEPWHQPGVHTSQTMHDGVDSYYSNGFLINFYSHTLSTGEGDAGNLVPDYIQYCVNAIHSNIWAANARDLYSWWVKRSSAQVTPGFSLTGTQSVASVLIKGSQDTNTAVDFLVPSFGSPTGLQVMADGVVRTNGFRTVGQMIKVRVGTATNLQVSYVLVPQAKDDSYPAEENTPKHVPNPGVLGNDWGGPAWSGLAATTLTGPQHGALILTNAGGFTYTPASNFFGTDCFTYQLGDGVNNFGTATVELFVANTNAFFNDDFTRCAGNAIGEPWQYFGTWSSISGVLHGTSAVGAGGNCFITADWTDYSVQARVQLPAGAFGGGLGGRLNSIGGHYAAWIYPENSGGGSNLLRLVKFANWAQWGYPDPSTDNHVPLSQVILASPVNNTWHDLKLTFSSNQIQVYYESNLVISVSDTNSPVYQGGITIDRWDTDPSKAILVDDVIVTP